MGGGQMFYSAEGTLSMSAMEVPDYLLHCEVCTLSATKGHAWDKQHLASTISCSHAPQIRPKCIWSMCDWMQSRATLAP